MNNNPFGMLQGMLQNPANLQQSYAQFAKGVSGNPQQIVQNMVATGQISQQQLNAAQQIAPMIANALGIRK